MIFIAEYAGDATDFNADAETKAMLEVRSSADHVQRIIDRMNFDDRARELGYDPSNLPKA